MDVLELIKADHRSIEKLFSEIEKTEDTHKLYDCFNKLYQSLRVHTEVEEQSFYPVVGDRQDTQNLINVAQKEHDEVKQMLEDVSSFSPTSPQFKAKIQELKQAFQHHVSEEENEVFAKVSQYISPEEREQLSNEFTSLKQKLQTEMSVAT